jgi:hypothetical protein
MSAVLGACPGFAGCGVAPPWGSALVASPMLRLLEHCLV